MTSLLESIASTSTKSHEELLAEKAREEAEAPKSYDGLDEEAAYKVYLQNKADAKKRANNKKNVKGPIPKLGRTAIMTLQTIFPTLLVPALDLLDEKLVLRMVLKEQSPETDHRIYYVRSTMTTGRGRWLKQSETRYEVRTMAWNCTCAGFVFAKFGGPISSDGVLIREGLSGNIEGKESSGGAFGGLTLEREDMPPLCKHLLACVLAEECGGVFEKALDIKEVTREGMAAWASGKWWNST
jgi:hypothetical protein